MSEKTNVAYEEPKLPEAASWPAPMGDEAFYGLAGDVVRAIAPHSEADPVALLVSFLAGFGNLVGRAPYFRVEADEHRCNLDVVLVGETAKGRKGVSWGHPRKIFKLVDEQWVNDRVKSGLSSGEGIIWDVRDRRGDDDEGITDKRLLIHEPEYATVLRRMEREGNTLSAVLREAWDGRKLSILTKNSPATATDAHISVLAHTTADELRRYLNRTEMANGFANRFLFFCVRRSQCLPHGGRLDDKIVESLANRIKCAIDSAHNAEIWWDADGAKAWEDIYGVLSQGQSGMVGAVMGRAEAQVVRLALLYAVLDGAGHIRLEHLKAAVEVLWYAETSAAYIFGNNIGDPIADMVLAELQAAGGDGLAKTDLTLKFGRHPEQAARLSRALGELVRGNRIVIETRPTEGRPETRYRIA